MNQGVNIQFSPLEQKKFREWVRKESADNKKKCKGLIIKHTLNLEKRSKMSAPVGKGFGVLRGSIHHVFSNDGLGGMVYVGVKYAPYQEFGTGTEVMVLPGYEAYAMQFKGRGIRKVNIRPRMYFFRHFEVIKKELIKDLNKLGFNERSI